VMPRATSVCQAISGSKLATVEILDSDDQGRVGRDSQDAKRVTGGGCDAGRLVVLPATGQHEEREERETVTDARGAGRIRASSRLPDADPGSQV
jgi:hypothetical protein